MESSVEIIEEIGKGASSVVYRVRSNKFPNQDLAMKQINLSLSNKKEERIKFIENEIGSLSGISHENIVKMLDCCFHKHDEYRIFFEFCSGGNLMSIIKTVENKGLEEKRAFEIMKDLVNGMMYLLSKGIIHRDLKPENILFKHNKAMIADFGFADYSYSHESETPQEFLGTPAYASPQILKSEEFTIKSDVWSLGVIFYQMIFGVHPFISPGVNTITKLYEAQKKFSIKNAGINNRDPILLEMLEGMLRLDEAARWDIIRVSKALDALIGKKQANIKKENDLFMSIDLSKRQANNALEDKEKNNMSLAHLKKMKWVSNYLYYRLEVCALWNETVSLLDKMFALQEFLLMQDVYHRLRYSLHFECLLKLHIIEKSLEDDESEPIKSLKAEFSEHRKSAQFKDFEEISSMQTTDITQELIKDYNKIKEILDEEISKASIDMELFQQLQEFLESTNKNNMNSKNIEKIFETKRSLCFKVLMDIQNGREFLGSKPLMLALYLKFLLFDVNQEFPNEIVCDVNNSNIPSVAFFLENTERLSEDEMRGILRAFEVDMLEKFR